MLESEKVHPKLLRILSFEELFDQNLDTTKCEEKYNTVIKPLIDQYYKTFDEMLNSHMRDFLEGWVLMHPEEHFAMSFETGNYIKVVPHNAYDFLEDDVLIDVELQDYWDVVREIKDDFRLRPFWERSYTMYGNGHRPTLSSYTTPQKYIKYNRELYSAPENTSKVLADLAKDLSSLPFEINYPILGRDEKSAIHHGDMKKMVKHHKVLHAFFETYGNDISTSDCDYSSFTDADENIKFTRITY